MLCCVLAAGAMGMLSGQLAQPHPTVPLARLSAMNCCVQETCDAVPADSPAQQFYCEPDEPPGCLYHEKSSWCTDTALTDCHILQPLNNGDCKDPQNMLSRLSSNSATEVGIYYGPQAICIGVPNGQLSRGLRTWPIDDACVASVSYTQLRAHETKAKSRMPSSA